MNYPEHIFKAYDIRGLVDGEMDAELAYRVGRAFAVFVREQGGGDGKKLVAGYDMRGTSRPFHTAMMRGMNDEGFDAVNIGLVSTPLFNFACAHFPEYAGGVMVTASHNPAQYNGFKMTLGNGMPVGRDSGMSRISELARAGEWREAGRRGAVEARDVLPDYTARLFELVRLDEIAPMRIVVDAGNGMAKATLPAVLEHLPVSADYLYLEPDGNFPNHEANPLKTETLRDLQSRVKEVGADFGFALDGDADRLGLVDERGEVVPASLVCALVGLEVLRDNPRALMSYDVRTSAVVKEMWEAAGAQTVLTPVGHALIKKIMHERDVMFGSELSLHLYFKEMHYLEAPDVSLLYLLRMLSREKKSLSELVAPLKKYHHSGEINYEVKDKETAMKRVEDHFISSALETSHIDGVRMSFDWGWLSVRASNTEPVLRLNLEARTREEMEARAKEAASYL